MEKSTVTVKDNKATILKAYERVLARINATKASQFVPGALKETVVDQDAIEHVKTKEWDLGVVFAQTRSAIDGNLRTIEEGLAAEKKELDITRRALDALKAELDDLYGISSEAETFAALVEAQKIEREAWGLELTAVRENLRAECADGRADLENDRSAAELDKERQNQEWNYAFNRERKRKSDEFADSLSKLRKEWDLEVAQAQDKLNAREEVLRKDEEGTAILKDQVALYPAKLDAAESVARKQAAQSYGIEVAALKRGYEADIKVIRHEADTQFQQREAAEHRAVALEEKLGTAYAQVQAVAGKALDAQANALVTSEVQRAIASMQSVKGK